MVGRKLSLLHHTRRNLRGRKQAVPVLVVKRRRHRGRRSGDAGESPRGSFHLGLLGEVPHHGVRRHGVEVGGLVAAGVADAGDEVVHALVLQGLEAVVVAREVVSAVLLQQRLQVVDQVLGAAVVAHGVPAPVQV